MLKRIITTALLATSAACTTVHSAYLSNLSAPAQRAAPIEAEASKSVFLGLNFSNDYVFEARDKLYAQCPQGTVTGVLSTYESTSYVIVTTHEVRVRGFCVSEEPGGARTATVTASAESIR